MRPDFLLHIGAGKTGSSAIQRFVRENIHHLRADNFAIPDYNLYWGDEISGEQVLALQAMMEHANAPKEFEQVFARLLATRPSNTTILISGENLANVPSPDLIGGALYKYDVRAILYIRRQDELLWSWWQQWSSKTRRGFDGWLLEAVQTLGHWEQVIENWQAIVGIGNLDVRIFEHSNFYQGNIVYDFVQAIGLNMPMEAFVMSDTAVNQSPNTAVSELVSGNKRIFVDEHDNRFYHIMNSLTNSVYDRSDCMSVMTKSQRDAIVWAYREENERVRAKFFPDKLSLFETIDHAKYNYLDSVNVLSEQNRFLCEAIYALAKRAIGG
jgi:hypothetical protein